MFEVERLCSRVNVAFCFLCTLIVCVALSPTLGAEVYWVSPQGSDAVAGTVEQPWQTISYGVTKLQPGDTLKVGEGRYEEEVVLTCAGTEEAPITIEAPGEGEAVITAGWSEGRDAAALRDNEDGVQHLVLRGLKITDSYWGVRFEQASNVLIEDCEFTGCRMAVQLLDGERLTLRRLYMHDNHYGAHIGVKAANAVRGVLIEDSRAENNWGQGAWGNNTDGFCIEDLCRDVAIRRCVASGHDDAGFDIKPPGSAIERCLAYENRGEGFKVWGDGSRLVNCIARHNADTGITIAGAMELLHCTIAYNGRCAFRPQAEDIREIVLRNCIIAFNFVRQYIARGGEGMYDGDYNLYYALPGELIWKVMDGQGGQYTVDEMRSGKLPMGAHDLFADPLFVDGPGGDLHPQADSPAIGAGTPLPDVTTDYDGAPRPAEGAVTLGAFEGSTERI